MKKTKSKKTKKVNMSELMTVQDGKSFLKDMESEIKEEFQEKIKTKVKSLMKEIAMTERLLIKQKAELDAIMKGKKQVLSEDEFLFGR